MAAVDLVEAALAVVVQAGVGKTWASSQSILLDQIWVEGVPDESITNGNELRKWRFGCVILYTDRAE